MIAQLFPELHGGGAFDSTVVNYVELPDGRRYQFQYNSYAEMARVVLPTGGAIEYDYAAGSRMVTPAVSSQLAQRSSSIVALLSGAFIARAGLAAPTRAG